MSQQQHIFCDNHSLGTNKMDPDKKFENLIKSKLSKIKNDMDLGSLEFDLSSRKIDVNKIDLGKAKDLREIWLEISNFSIWSFINFDFFKQLYVLDKNNSPEYNTAMESMGYIRTNGFWNLVKQPSIETVTENLYNYCKYSFIVDLKTDNLKKVPVRKCEHCDNVIEEGDIQCSVCFRDLNSYKEEPLSIGENVIHEKDKFMGTDQPACDKLSQEEELLCRNDGREDKECYQERDGGREGTDKDKKKSFSPDKVSKNTAAEAGITNSKDIEREESKGGWSCGQCSFINKLGTSNCDVCHFIRETEVTNQYKNRGKDDTKKGVYVEAGLWRCTSCSTENTLIMAVCSSCKHWRCEKCTFVNKEWSRKCETCGNKNDNLALCCVCQNNYIDEWRKRKKDRRSPKMANQEIGENNFEEVDICSNCKVHKQVYGYGFNALGDFVKGIHSALWSGFTKSPKETTDGSTWY